jgi:hypothetical protein
MKQSEIVKWKTDGSVVVRKPIPVPEQVEIMKNIYTKFTIDTINHDFGNDGATTFPCKYNAINKVALDDFFIRAAQELLETYDVMLIQSVAWAKYGEKGNNSDQRMHMDYGNNSLSHPPPFDSPEVVAFILYYSDTSIVGGGTRFVPRLPDKDDRWYRAPYIHMPGQAGIPFENDKNRAENMLSKRNIHREELYRREKCPVFHVGDVLVYRHDVYHRGTPVKKNCIRYVHNIAYKKRDCTWIYTWTNFAQKMYYGYMEQFILTLNPVQLYVLGMEMKNFVRYFPRL